MGRSWPNEVRDPPNGLYQTKNLKWSKSHCCLKKVLYSPRSSTSSPGPPKWKVDLIELLGQRSVYTLGRNPMLSLGSGCTKYVSLIEQKEKPTASSVPRWSTSQVLNDWTQHCLSSVIWRELVSMWYGCGIRNFKFQKKNFCDLNFKSKSLASYYRK